MTVTSRLSTSHHHLSCLNLSSYLFFFGIIARCPCHVAVVNEVKLCQLLKLLAVYLDTHAVKLLS